MLRARLIVQLTAAGMLIGAATPAFAIDAKEPVLSAPRPTKMAPTKLTDGECKGLGGSVIQQIGHVTCDSGYVCSTTDKDGVIHRACITKQ